MVPAFPLPALRRLDVVGLGLVAAALAWTLVSAAANDDSRPVPTLAALVLAPVAVAAGRAARRRLDGGTAPVALGGLAGVLLGLGLTLDPLGAGSPPLGYANANGSLFGLLAVAVAAVLAATPGASPATRRGGGVLLVTALVLCGLTGSIGAGAATALGLALAAGMLVLRRPWAAIPAAALAVVGLLGVTAAAAVGAGPQETAADSLGVRVSLWREAAQLAQASPVTGAGPGRYGSAQTFSTDPDLRRAHSGPLQQLAEQGGPGLVLLLALGGWGVAALWAARDDPAAALGAAALAAVGLEATFDWVLSEPSVSLGLAVVVGLTSTGQGRSASGAG